MPDPVKRPALLNGQARCAAPAGQIPDAAGKVVRWRLNSGARMRTCVGGIGECELIIDLSGVSFEHPEIPMLREHGRRPNIEGSDWYIVPCGRFTGCAVDPTGIYGVPLVYTPETPAEEEMPSLKEGGEVAALMKRGHPWQSSVVITGALAQYERVNPGQDAQVNGRTEAAGDHIDALPLFILRAGVVSEASVCLFGADADTGAVAASRPDPTNPKKPESPVSDIKALLARHGKKHAAFLANAVADGKSDEQIAAELSASVETDHNAALAAKDAELTKANAALTAANAKTAELQAKLDAMADPEADAEKNADGTPKDKTVAAGTSANGMPKDILAGMAALSKEGSKLIGFPLRKAALKRWPALRDTIPSMGTARA